MVTVEMVRRDVQRHADLGPKATDGFQLEARKLEHVPLLRPRRIDHRRNRRPDIAAHLHRNSRLAQDMARQRGGGGLAVRSGNADDGTLEEITGQLHFADDRGATPPRRFEGI